MDRKKVDIIENLAKLSIVGVGMANHPGVAARFFKALNQIGMDIHLVTTSEIKISAIIDKQHLSEAAKAIHEEFKMEKPTIN
jgi:aspartate kinase